MTLKTAMVTAGIGCLAVLMVSCATPALWDATDPNQWAKASKTTVTTNDLATKGVEYQIDNSTGDIYIPKSQLHKLGDYTIRVLATPIAIAVTLDAVGGVTVICGALLMTYSGDSITSSPTDNWGRPIDETTGHPISRQRPIRGSRPWYDDAED